MKLRLFILLLVMLFVVAQAVIAERVFVRSSVPQEQINDRFFLQLGNELMRQGNQDLALKAYQKGLEYDQNPALYYNIGYYYYLHNEVSKAADQFFRAASLNTAYASPRMALMKLYQEQGNLDAALTYAKQLLAIDQNNAEYWFNYGVLVVDIFRMNGNADLDEAINAFSAAEQLSPGFPHAKENAMWLHGLLARNVQ
ncbi:MAG: tetratricopeptide repeat protein [archaeon]